MFCRQCGIKLPEDARFCTGCGTRVILPPPVAEPPLSPPAGEAVPAVSGDETIGTALEPKDSVFVPVTPFVEQIVPASPDEEKGECPNAPSGLGDVPDTPITTSDSDSNSVVQSEGMTGVPQGSPVPEEPLGAEEGSVRGAEAVRPEDPVAQQPEVLEILQAPGEENMHTQQPSAQTEGLAIEKEGEAQEPAPGVVEMPGLEPFPTAPPLPPQPVEPVAPEGEESFSPVENADSPPEAPAAPSEKPELEFAPPPPPFVEPSKEEDHKKEKRRKKKSVAGKIVLVLFVVAALLLAAASGVYYMGVKGYIQLPDWVPVPPGIEEELPAPEPEDNDPIDDTSDNDAPQEDEPVVIDLSGDSAYNWPDFAHVSDYYLFAREDGDYLFFLPNSVEAEVESKLFRFDKKVGDIEVIVDLAAFGDEEYRGTVDTFTLMGDYLYFSSRLEAARSAYFRVPKEGGEIQFLFIQELSYMQPYNGSLYFVFPRQEAYGVYDPARDVLPALYPLETPAGVTSVQTNFSVNGDMLYYGVYSGGDADYIRMDLVTGETETILSSEELGAYMLQPVMVGEEVFYVQYDYDEKRSTWMRAAPGAEEAEQIFRQNSSSGMAMFVARIGNYFLFQDGNSYYWSPVDNPTDSSVRVTSGWQPFAVSDNWIYFPDKLVPLDERSNPLLMSQAVEKLYDSGESAFEKALELYADMASSDYAAVEEGAQPPDSTISLTPGSNETRESLLEVFREDDEIALVMAVWALSDLGGSSADANALQQGISFLFTATEAVDWMGENGNTIPDELVQAFAGELLGVNGASLYDLARSGAIAGIGVNGNDMVFHGWDLGNSSLYTIDLQELPKEQGGAWIATLEGEEMDGTMRSYRVVCEKNDTYKAFPYRILRVESD